MSDDVASGLGDVLGTNSSSKQIQPNWYDPLGPSAVGKNGKPVFSPTGGIPIRNAVFNEIGDLQPQFQNTAGQAAGALQSAAANPGYATEQNLAQDQLAGKYLNGSPALDNAMAATREAANASSANNNARIRSQFATNGMSFGTANQEAQQSNQAATNAQTNQAEDAARLQNYQNERGIQQNSGAMLDQSLASPINYLAQIPNQYLGPLSQVAQITAGLAGNGNVVQPDTQVTPGATTQLLGAVGQL